MRQIESHQDSQDSIPGLTPERGPKEFHRLYKPYPNLADTRTVDTFEWDEIGQGGYAVVFSVRALIHGALPSTAGETKAATYVVKLYYPNGKQHPPKYYAKRAAKIFKILKENPELSKHTWETLYWDGDCQLLMTPGFQEGYTVLTYLPQSPAAKEFRRKIQFEPIVVEDVRSQMEAIAIKAARAGLTVKADAYFFLVKQFPQPGTEIKVMLGDLDNIAESENLDFNGCLEYNMKKVAVALKEFIKNYVKKS